MATESTRNLDVRTMPTWERHPRIFAAFDALSDDASLTLVTDHEPRPLRLQFEQRHPQRFVWEQRHIGTGRWEVLLRRLSPAPAGAGLRNFFRSCPLLCDAREETLAAFERHSREQSLDRGAVLTEQDVQWPYLGLLKSGLLASIASTAGGRDQNLYDILPYDSFGDLGTVDGGRTIGRVTVASLSAGVVLIPRGIALSAFQSDAFFARKLAVVCAQRSRKLAGRFVAYVAHSAIARVAAALLPYAPPDAGLSPALLPLGRMTQNELATVAGTAKEVAARAIAELEAAGALTRARGHISHLDRAQLQRFIPEE